MIKFWCHFRSIYQQWKRESVADLANSEQSPQWMQGFQTQEHAKIKTWAEIRALPASVQAADDEPPSLLKHSKVDFCFFFLWRPRPPPIHCCAEIRGAEPGRRDDDADAHALPCGCTEGRRTGHRTLAHGLHAEKLCLPTPRRRGWGRMRSVFLVEENNISANLLSDCRADGVDRIWLQLVAMRCVCTQ
jgi:hypothetical protein